MEITISAFTGSLNTDATVVSAVVAVSISVANAPVTGTCAFVGGQYTETAHP